MPTPPDNTPRMHRGAHARLFRYAKQNHRPMIPAETVLWEALQNKKLDGWKFRRQHPFGTYILDFYCHAARLCVEVDGGYHDTPEQQAADAKRTAFLEHEGIRTIRFTNGEVTGRLEDVLNTIRRHLK